MRNLRDIIKPALSLLLICFITALLLALVNGMTKDTIEARALADAEEQRKLVMLDAGSFKEADGWQKDDGSGLIRGVWAAYKGEDLLGYVFSATPKGYGGEMTVTIGITTGLQITGVRLGDNNETPGLGTKAGEESFIGQYKEKDAGKGFKLVKQQPASDNEIKAISGATITSNAVTSAVQAASDMAVKLLENGGGSK